MFKNIINKIQTDRLFFKAQRNTRHGDYTASIDLYNRAIAISPRDSWLYLHKAISLAEANLYDDAIEQVNIAISIDNNKHAYYMYLGIFKFDTEKYDEAKIAFNMALELSPNNSIVIGYINIINVIKGIDIIESLNTIKSNIRSTNSDFVARLLVRCESALLQKKETVLSLEDCVSEKRSPSTAQKKNSSFILDEIICKTIYMRNIKTKLAHLHLIEARKNLNSGLTESAIGNYQKSLEYLPGLHAATDGLIKLYISNKMYDAFFDFIRQEPSFNDISKLLNFEDSHEMEKEQSDQIIKSNASIIMAASQLYYHMGDYNKSFKYFSMLDDNYSKEYYIKYYCGLCKVAMNKLKEAFVWFKMSMEIINPKIAEKRLDELIKCYS